MQSFLKTVYFQPRRLYRSTWHCHSWEHVAEIWSPPRIVPVCQSMGLKSTLSVDILLGWDLSLVSGQQKLYSYLQGTKVRVLMMSPPCTALCQLMVSNWSRMLPSVREAAIAEGLCHWQLACWQCEQQHRAGLGFCLEHPSTALSWRTDEIQQLLQLEGIFLVHFDQCQFGLKAGCGTAMKKRTTFLTNIDAVRTTFGDVFCKGGHAHVKIQGWDPVAQMPRSRLAQHYPPELCAALARCFCEYCR